MRLSFFGVVLLMVAVTAAGTEEKKKPVPPDEKAYKEADKIKDPQAKIDALRKVAKDYPKSRYAGFANDSILDTLAEKFPDRIKEIDHQVDLVLKKAKGSKFEKASTYSNVADTLGSAGVLLPKAEKLARKAVAGFQEKAFIADEKKSYTTAKMKIPLDAEIAANYKIQRASMISTLGEIRLKQGDAAEGKRLLEEAYGDNPMQSSTAVALAQQAAKEGDKAKALDYFAQARLTGVLNADDQQQFESLYRERNGGSMNGLDAWLDTEYEKRFPENIPVEKYKPGPQRSDRVVLVEMFTGSGCPPCAGADVAMDAAMKRFDRKELAVLMFHQHIPHPDPMANPDTVKRSSYYDVGGVPTMAVDGKTEMGGESRRKAKEVYDRVTPKITKELDSPAEAHITLRTSEDGGVVKVHAAVDGVKSDSKELKLQVALVEGKLRYSGENGIRFHPLVVRSLCGTDGGGIPIKAGNSEGDCVFDIQKISDELKTYLSDYEKHNERYGPFQFSEQKYTIDPKDLKVVAFVEDAGAKHVLQAAYMDVVAR